jgi:hypothetical protein
MISFRTAAHRVAIGPGEAHGFEQEKLACVVDIEVPRNFSGDVYRRVRHTIDLDGVVNADIKNADRSPVP